MADINIKFPIGGIHEGAPFTEQPPSTTSDALNVTGQDPVSGRTRGAQRAGMSKYNPNAIGSNKIASISSINYDSSPASISAYPSGSEVTQWSKTLPNKSSAWCIATDTANNVYVVDSGATVSKYNPTGYLLYTQKVPVKDDGHEIRSIAVDQSGIIYVAVSAGGQQKTACIFALEEIDGATGQYLEKVWDYQIGKYVSTLVYASGKLYAGINNSSSSEAYVAVLSNVGTAVPVLERSVSVPFPLGDIDISPKDGGLLVSSPINTSRGGENVPGASFKSPKSVDWDPSKLEGYEKRIWAWLDSTDIDGDGTNNSAYNDGDEVRYWTDKSGNGRDLFTDSNITTVGPLFSKEGFNGLDCLSFSSVSSSGQDSTTQYLTSSANASVNGDSALNANNSQNLGLFPSHSGASYAVFVVFEALDDGVNSQHVFSQQYLGFTDNPADLYFRRGIVALSAHHCATGIGSLSVYNTGATPTALGYAPSVLNGYAPKNCTLIGVGSDSYGSGANEALGEDVSTVTAEQMQLNEDTSLSGTSVCHSGSSKSNKFIVSYICRNKVAGAVPAEPLFSGEDAVKFPGYQTTDASHFRVNGKLCQSFAGYHLNSTYPVFVGKINPLPFPPGTTAVYNYAQTSFKGRICEILVLKEWYYRPDETSAPVRLNVCSSRPPAYVTADHGDYSGAKYFDPAGDYTGAGLADENEGSRRIYETELIEGYLAHKWGIADELPDSLVTYLRINGASTIPNSAAITLPNPGGAASIYQFYTSSTASLGVGVRGGIYVPPGAVSREQLKAQAYEIYNAINGDGNFSNGANEYVYAKPPTFSGISSTIASERYAIIEIRARNSMSHAFSTSGVGHTLTSTSPAIISFIGGMNSSYTSGTTISRMSGRARSNPSMAALGFGINYSIHPFALHRRNVHKNSSTPPSWTVADYFAIRTIGGPPRADGKRKFQPLQYLSSSSQCLAKYDKDSGYAKWSLYNGSPEGILTGAAYTGLGGVGFSVSVNSNGLVYASGQRSLQQQYPSHTESYRRGITYPENLNDVRATNDLGASSSLAWQKQVSSDTGLDNNPGWSRSSVDEKGNLVLPVADQESTTASVIVYEPTAGTELHRHSLSASPDRYQIGLSAAATSLSISLPSNFVNPRSSYIYLGTRAENSAVITFTGQPSDGEYVILSDGPITKAYRFKNVLAAANDILIGGSLSSTIANLRGAINGTAGSYGSGTTANTFVVVRNSDSTRLYISARDPEPSGGTGLFEFATTTSVASMSAVEFNDACIRRINLLNVTPSGSISSYRSTKNIAVDGSGVIYSFGKTGSPSAVAGSQFISSNAQYYNSAVLYQKLYITNGFQVLVYDPLLDSVSDIESKQGGSPTERWSLVASWRGRLVLGRGLTAPHNWIMSAIGDPSNWDLFPPVVSPSQAVSGVISRAGIVPDVINALIPYSDDLMLFGGDHSIYRLTGDPMSGGQMDLVTDVTGIAFGRAWDKDPQGTLYFVSSRGALYAWPPGGRIVELSLGKFEQRLSNINFSLFYTQLVWNDMDRTLHIFVMPFGGGEANVRHFRYERDSKAFWEDLYGMPVTAACVSDGDDPNDRKMLIGSSDNIIRVWDSSAPDDDGVGIDSYVTFGPFGSNESELRLTMLQAVLSDNQSGANVQLFASDTPDVIGDPVWAGKLTSGRNPNMFTRVRGSYFWIRLRNASAGERWAFESMTARVAQAGRRRVR